MTERHKGYIVTLKDDVREDDSEFIINAIRMIKGVVSVEPLISDHIDHMAREHARRELREQLFDILKIYHP